MRKFAVMTALLLCAALQAQDINVHYRWMGDYAHPVGKSSEVCFNPYRIPVPDIPGYHTYKADLHMHTIFSDANVTPSTRVYEAILEDIDILAITDHHPGPRHKYGREDMNVAYEEAKPVADEMGLKLIRGFELTGKEPIGHINIIFTGDLNRYKMSGGNGFSTKEADRILGLAKEEGAFITANHPGWPDQDSTLSDYIAGLMENGTINAIEVFNDNEFYPMAIDHALKYNLAMFGCTDCHQPTNQRFDLDRSIRDLTLIFAKDKSDEALKEALLAGRTIAWANDTLAGREELMRSFLHACIKVVKFCGNEDKVRIRFENVSAIPFTMQTDNPKLEILIPAQGYAEIVRKKTDLDMPYKVMNTYITSTKHVEIPLSFLLPEEGAELPE